MKNVLLLLTLCLALISCEVRTSDNGDFDGLWQLTVIDSLSNRTSVDVHTSGVYWAVQVHLLSVRKVHGSMFDILFRFDLEGDSLHLQSPYYDESGENGTLPEHDVTILQPYGIDRSSQSFLVVTLNADEMLLQKEDVRLRFRKY